MTADLPMSPLRSYPRLPLPGAPCDIAGMKARQRIKLQEIRAALVHSGISTLDEQTNVLGLSRSTAWSVVKPNHKSSGLSARTINRMLDSPRLPGLVRQKIFEYAREKIAGLYGHSERRRREFAACLSTAQFNGLIAEALGRDYHRRQLPQPQTKHPVVAESQRQCRDKRPI